MALSQANRIISVSSPLGPDALLLRAMSGTEALGRMFQYDLHLLSEDPAIDIDAILGQHMTISMEIPGGGVRYFDGIVARFSHVGSLGTASTYHATLYPWLWFLTRTSDCRIFQNMTVPDIIKQVFRDNGFTDFEQVLSGQYRSWEYCVQYRETDFNFVSRLMEQEGFYYYFVHENGRHVMKMTDSIGGHKDIVNPDVMFLPPSENITSEHDYINTWSLSRDVQPGAFVQDDYDFKKPKSDLMAKLVKPFKHAHADGEIYDYPGEYYTNSDGNNYVRSRFEELQAQYERNHGDGIVHTLYTGGLFNLTDCPRQDQNKKYLVVGCSYQMENNEYGSDAAAGDSVIKVDIEAMDSQQQFRTARTTPKPMVQGPQTAVVTGPAGEEIWTDEYGRVKVQFHWDRYGKMDENSSCWIRVSHPWAGKKWGAIALPRIGHEVIVDFIEGDPDQPIITGRVYNGDNMPPYDLPANQTQSGMKSRSSKGGTGANFNEIRFEDKKGQEEVFIHAEKDQLNEVENDETTWVGHDRHETVDNDETIIIKGKRDEDVTKDEIVKVHGKRHHTVDGNDTLVCHKNILVQADDSITLETGAAKIVMKKNGDITVTGKNIKTTGSAKIDSIASSVNTVKGSKVLVN